MASQADAVRQFVARRPRATSDARHDRVIVVAAGKGGVGTSTMSLLLGVAVAGHGIDTLLVDAADNSGSLQMLINAAVDQRDGEPAEILPCLALASPCGTPDDSQAGQRIRYRRLAARFGEYGCVIVDAGSRLDTATLAIADARQLLLVCTSDRVSVTATYAMYKHLRGATRTLSAGVILNRGTAEQAERAANVLRAASQHFLHDVLEPAAMVPEDERLAAAADEGALLDRVQDTHAFAALSPVAMQAIAKASPSLFVL